MATLADLNWYLSGGAANTDPDLSLGGAKGAQIGAQTVTGSMPGVSIDRSEGNSTGAGALTYSDDNETLEWECAGQTPGDAVDVTADGEYVLFSGASGYLVVTITASLLPTSNDAQTITIAQPRNNLFDDINKDESFDGDTEYRCFYVWNDHATDGLIECATYIAAQPTGNDTIEIGLDDGGVGTTDAVTVADESTAPSNVTFSTPADSAGGIAIGDIPAGEGIALWVKRIVPTRTLTGAQNDTLQIAIEVRY